MGDAEIGSRGTPCKARIRSNRRSHQVEYLIAMLKYFLLNDPGFGFYNAEVITEELNIKCTW